MPYEYFKNAKDFIDESHSSGEPLKNIFKIISQDEDYVFCLWEAQNTASNLKISYLTSHSKENGLMCGAIKIGNGPLGEYEPNDGNVTSNHVGESFTLRRYFLRDIFNKTVLLFKRNKEIP